VAGRAVRVVGLADRRGEHDGPVRRRRLEPRGGRVAVPGRARGPAGRVADRRARPRRDR
jgi:hypothetical protein